MANPKRASMREGPLAALFKKTEGEEGEEHETTSTSESAPVSEAAMTEAAARTPHPRESGLPHPALKASTDAREDVREDSVPTPRERLRHAFSSEIPENVMERSARPVMDDYSREHPTAIGAGSAGPAG